MNVNKFIVMNWKVQYFLPCTVLSGNKIDALLVCQLFSVLILQSLIFSIFSLSAVEAQTFFIIMLDVSYNLCSHLCYQRHYWNVVADTRNGLNFI